jgi:hypothetical protein
VGISGFGQRTAVPQYTSGGAISFGHPQKFWSIYFSAIETISLRTKVVFRHLMKIESKDFSIPSGSLIIDATHFNTVYMQVYVYVCSYSYFKPMLRGVWLSKYLVHVSTCNTFLTKIKKYSQPTIYFINM